jgi:predicted nucleic acid-binding protein
MCAAPAASGVVGAAGNLTPYDACYVALARNLGCPLVTGDRRLARAPGLGVPLITV